MTPSYKYRQLNKVTYSRGLLKLYDFDRPFKDGGMKTGQYRTLKVQNFGKS